MGDNHKINVGEELKHYFREKGMTQSDIASKLGITQASVSALMRGKPFGSKTAKNWADNFGFNIKWLLTGEGEMLKSSDSLEVKDNTATFGGDIPIFNQHNQEAMNVFNRMLDVIEQQSKQMDRIVSQIEKSGERAERMMEIVEKAHGMEFTKKKGAV